MIRGEPVDISIQTDLLKHNGKNGDNNFDGANTDQTKSLCFDKNTVEKLLRRSPPLMSLIDKSRNGYISRQDFVEVVEAKTSDSWLGVKTEVFDAVKEGRFHRHVSVQ